MQIYIRIRTYKQNETVPPLPECPEPKTEEEKEEVRDFIKSEIEIRVPGGNLENHYQNSLRHNRQVWGGLRNNPISKQKYVSELAVLNAICLDYLRYSSEIIREQGHEFYGQLGPIQKFGWNLLREKLNEKIFERYPSLRDV